MEKAEISALVRASLESKIIEAFKSTPEMIDDLVKSCLSREVTEHGSPPTYHDRTKMPYLSFLAQSAVQSVAREAVNEYVQTMAPAIKQQVKQKLSSGEMVDALTSCIMQATKNPYDVKIEFKTAAD
jgi:hypothetical protein